MAPDAAMPMGRVRVWYPRVASTMELTMALAMAGAPHGTLVEAAEQTAGRGRHGRRWEAPAGSAFLGSWLLRMPHGLDLAGLSPAVAAATLRAIEAVEHGAPVQFKWPNDVLIDGRKVAGILLVSRVTPAGAVIIAGIGINIAPESVPSRTDASCLAEWSDVSVAQVRQRLATELDAVVNAYREAKCLPESERLRLEARMQSRGELVEVLVPGGSKTGIAIGLTPDGGLRLGSLVDGSELVLRVGEIVRGPRGVAGSRAESAVYLPEHNRC